MIGSLKTREPPLMDNQSFERPSIGIIEVASPTAQIPR